MVSEELVKRIKNGTVVWPYMWVVEIGSTDGTLAPEAAVTETRNFVIFFLDSADKVNWTIEQHYDNDIYTLNNYIQFFFEILRSRRDIFETDSITYSKDNYINFGDYIVDEGMKELILNGGITGIQLQMSIPFIIQSCDDFTVAPNCPTIAETFNGTSISSPVTQKAIVVQSDAVGNPQVGAIQTDTPTSLVIEVEAAGGGSIDVSINSTLYADDRTTDLDIPVHDTAGNDVGTVAPLVDVEIADVTQTLNGDAITNNKAETSKAITIRYADDTAVVVTTITDTETVFIGEVPNLDLPVHYVRPILEQVVVSGVDHDEKWHIDNNTFDYTIPPGTKAQELDPTDRDLLRFDNVWGHKFRFPGSLGGYFDSSDGLYYDVDGVLSDRDTEFLLSGNYYIIDEFTGLGWSGTRSGSASLPTLLGLVPTSRSGFDDFFVPCSAHFRSLIRLDKSLPLYLSNRPPFDIQLNLWSCTYLNSGVSNAWYYSTSGNMTMSGVSVSRAWAFVRAHYS